MDHDDDVRAALERRAVAGLLVAAVAAVLRVDHDVDAERPRDLHRAVPRAVVHEDDVVHVRLRHVGVGALERLLGVVRGHHDRDAAAGPAASDPTARQDDRQGPQQDRQVETEGPVVQVRQIVAQLDVGLGRVLARDLREARQPRARRVAQRVPRDRSRANCSANSGRSGRGPTRLMSPRTTFQSCGISSMRAAAQRPPDRRHARIVRDGEHRARLDLGAPPHRAQLPELEEPSVPAHPRLPVEHAARATSRRRAGRRAPRPGESRSSAADAATASKARLANAAAPSSGRTRASSSGRSPTMRKRRRPIIVSNGDGQTSRSAREPGRDALGRAVAPRRGLGRQDDLVDRSRASTISTQLSTAARGPGRSVRVRRRRSPEHAHQLDARPGVAPDRVGDERRGGPAADDDARGGAAAGSAGRAPPSRSRGRAPLSRM